MVEICLGTIPTQKSMRYHRMIRIRVIEVGYPKYYIRDIDIIYYKKMF